MSKYISQPGGVPPKLVATKGGGTSVTVGGVAVATFDADTKQDTLTPAQLSNIAAVPGKQDKLTAGYGIDISGVIISLKDFINPITGAYAPLQDILMMLGGEMPNPLTATEFDALGLSATDFDAYGISAYEFDFKAKTILI